MSQREDNADMNAALEEFKTVAIDNNYAGEQRKEEVNAFLEGYLKYQMKIDKDSWGEWKEFLKREIYQKRADKTPLDVAFDWGMKLGLFLNLLHRALEFGSPSRTDTMLGIADELKKRMNSEGKTVKHKFLINRLKEIQRDAHKLPRESKDHMLLLIQIFTK